MKTKLTDLIKAKKFDWVNSDITDEVFPEENPRNTDYKLYHFDKYISSEDAIKKMEKEGYVPANIRELLAWSGWNEKDWVIALGSVGEVSGDRHVPVLSRRGSERRLLLGWFDFDWSSLCRFLAVRNSISSPSDSALEPLETLDLESAIKKVEEAGYRVFKEI